VHRRHDSVDLSRLENSSARGPSDRRVRRNCSRRADEPRRTGGAAGENRDEPSSIAARDAQHDAIVEWGIPDHGALQRLTAIHCPTLIIQGDDDQMIPTKLSHLMAGLIPDAQIRIYDDAAHAFLFQYPQQVAADIGEFLDGRG
jgi:pimeloyl-ACP methyl ester carboxylesterase